MKIKIGKPVQYFGTYQLAKILLFWKEAKSKEVTRFSGWLSTYKSKSMNRILNNIHSILLKYCNIKRDSKFWVWILNDQNNLLLKILLLIDERRSRNIIVKIDEHDTWDADETLAFVILPMLKAIKNNKCDAPNVDDNDVPSHLRTGDYNEEIETLWFKKWDFVLNEMIFSFESLICDNHSSKIDFINMKQYNKRIGNGLRLFGKYYRNLWV